MANSVIVGAARTPIGRLLGSLKDFTGAELGGIAIRAALERAGVAPDAVQYTVMGQVLTAGAGQIPARQAAVAAGIPMTVPALTINKVCLSGLAAIALADQLIASGQYDVVVAGGQESMTQAPHLLPKSRTGVKFGDAMLIDHMAHDGLFCAFDQVAMGASTEKYNSRYGLTREQQDKYAVRSHQRAAAAMADGRFAEEIAEIVVRQRGGATTRVIADEGVRPDASYDGLAALRPAFASDGTITAGSASQISDGAAAVVLVGKEKAEELGIEPLAEIGAYGSVAGPDASLHEQPSNAINAALTKAQLDVDALDLVEINEAFAAVSLVSSEKLGLNPEIVNVDGGAIALGHPIGASGARLIVHLVHELRRRGGGLGAAALCGGGGQGDALLLTVPKP